MELESVKQLIMSLEKKFGKSINKQQDLHFLKQDIKDTVNLEIGINTLRRLFGFMPFNLPSKKTVDKLAIYLGYKNSIVFLSDTNTSKSWGYWHKTNAILLSKTITESDIHWLITNKHREDYFIYFSAILKEFLLIKNIDGLIKLFSIDELFMISGPNKIKIATIVGHRLRSYPESDFKLLEPLVSLDNFRNNILYLNVDYEYLNGYYGWLIENSIDKIKNVDEKLFTNLLLNFHLYLSGNGNYSNLYNEKIPKNCHTVLYGRYWAYQLLYFEKTNFNEIYNEIIKKSRKIESKIEFFHEIIPTLILLNKINQVKEILSLYFEELFNTVSWNQEYLKISSIIGQSFVLLKEKKYKLAATGIGYIDFSKIHFKQNYLKLFYLVCKYNSNKFTNPDPESQKAIKEEYNYLVNKSGFYFFTEEFLENYIENNLV